MKNRMFIAASALVLGLGLASAASAQGMGQPMQPGTGGMQGGQMQQGGMAGDGMQAERPMRGKKMMKRSSKKSMKRQRSM